MPLSENCFTFFYKISFPKRGINHLSFYLLSYTYKIALKGSGFNPLCGTFSKKEKETSLCPHKGHQFNRKTYYCVPGTRTQPLICVGCSVPYWVSCAVNKGGFFEIAFSLSSTHICLTLKCLLTFCLTLTRYLTWCFVCPRRSSFKGLLRSDILSS